MSFLKEPPRDEHGHIDLTWWDSLSLEEQQTYNIWESDLEKQRTNMPTEIVIKPEALDTSILGEGENESAIWRPSTFDEYIGQENLKKILNGYIKGTKELKTIFPHMMIDGKAGTGKTTIAYLLSKYLDVPFVETVATTLKSEQQLVDKLAECQGGILFLDEVHMLNSKLCNFILPLLEDFQINGKRIKPFTLFACTTEKGALIKNFKPFVDRMKIQFTLEDYTINELKILIKQFREKSYPDIKVDENVLNEIAKNSRYTPRIAIRYLESFIFMKCPITEVFKSYGIVKNGITKQDIKVLELLNEHEKGVGLQAISSYLGTSEENYMYSIEGYLLQKGLITRLSRGRQITELGKDFLRCLK